jgi:hypothetical protein
MANVMGYFQNAVPQGPQVAAVAQPQVPNQQPIAVWDSWRPTSFADPYVAGMRTSAGAVVAASQAAGMGVAARFANFVAWKAGAAVRTAKAAAKSGSFFGMQVKMTKAMSDAASMGNAGKAAYMAKDALKYKNAPLTAGPGAAFKATFLSAGNLARAIGTSALIAAPIAMLTNFLDWKAGKINEQQRNALIVADTTGYTVTGAISTLAGGMVAATALGAAGGAIAGIGAGFALGWLYEKYIRPRWGEWVRNALYAQQVAPPPPPPINMEPK